RGRHADDPDGDGASRRSVAGRWQGDPCGVRRLARTSWKKVNDMDPGSPGVLSDGQLADYERLGFLESISVLSDDEERFFRGLVDRTCRSLGERVTRFDSAHALLRWAWDLSTLPRILDCMERLIGPNILLKSTRLSYKYGPSSSFVGWHQDGFTERIEDARV